MGPNQHRAGGTVTVLGAGVAGLATAWELERLGYRVEVLEGSGRLGGRVFTHRFGTGPGAPVAELGAMRIPAGLAGELRPFRGLRPEPVQLTPLGPHAAETAAKFGLGTVGYFTHATADSGLGEVLLMIAVMDAVQAEYVWRRAQALRPAEAQYAAAS